MPVEQLKQMHASLLDCVACLSSDDLREQYHDDLSPLGWHLGHVAYIGQYWLHEVIRGDASRTAGMDQQFLPELIEKTRRQSLPGIDDLDVIADAYRDIETTLEALQADERQGHQLLERDYIGWFLLQHAAQHLEIMHMVLQQRQLKTLDHSLFPEAVTGTLSEPEPPRVPALHIESGSYPVGFQGVQAYDNECPGFSRQLEAFLIALTPVSNAEYLGFIRAGGYTREAYWSEAGWQWRQANRVDSPQHWHAKGDSWLQVTPAGVAALPAGDAVNGIAWHEAEAFAAYAGCRLPHELEWETAMKLSVDLTSTTGGGWEWCANTLYPYEGFQAFPYQRYSQPWFDQRHYVLRGAGPYTDACVRRPSFRNFYTADKRYAFSGLRLAASR